MDTFSVSFRLQRTTTEYAFVSVLVTDDMTLEQTDGGRRLNVPRLVERAVELGYAPDAVWYPETQNIEPHPIQRPRAPDGS